MKNTLMYADMSQLTRMFINLLDNGITYGKENGYVKIFFEEEQGYVCIRVEDNGIGIPENALDKIWNRFYQADKSRSLSQGFGLGLFMVKHIVDGHGGTIEVRSKVAEGTVFVVRLPR